MENRVEKIAKNRGYCVTEDGLFLNPKGDAIGTTNHNNYLATNIRVNKKITKLMSHRLQAFQKYGNNMYEKGIVVRHLNGNSLDNSWTNIAIGTQKQNMLDIPEQVRIKKARHATSFVRKHNKKEIKEYYNKVKSYNKTMAKFNISSKGTLHYVLNK